MKSSSSDINERILDEIDKLDADKKIKMFLINLLDFELEIIDQGNATYTDKYKELIDEVSK